MGLGMELAELYQQKRKRIEVPEEWHEKGVTEIWCTPINGLDVDVLQKKHKDFISTPSLGAMVELIIRKAENSQGEKLFGLDDRPALMKVDLNVISDIGQQMFNTVESVEDYEKN